MQRSAITADATQDRALPAKRLRGCDPLDWTFKRPYPLVEARQSEGSARTPKVGRRSD
jgi:hypothetical protein